ncbi:RNA polymerase sigma factor [Labilithrix luteola]|nr:sigma-70 family RNA polymerase sigma factor [Labilithrix luteola]
MTPRELFETYAAFVWRTLRYQSVAERDLDDVSQEVFVIVFRKLPEFEPHGSLRAWIYGICIRVARDYRNRAHKRHEVLYDDVSEHAGGVSNAEIERLAAQKQLHQMLQRLDEEKRAVLVLHELEGLPMNEVAELVQCPVKTAYSRLAAARKQMLTMLTKAEGSR